MDSASPVDEQLKTAAELIVRTRIFYDIWNFFEGAETRATVLPIMQRFSEFFRFDAHAHFVSFIIYIAALFEKRKDTINLPRLAKQLESVISAHAATEIATTLKQVAPVASKVAILRSNLFAHRSAGLSYADTFRRAAVTPNELRGLTDSALEVVNRLLMERGFKDRAFAELPLEDTKEMLKALKGSTS